MSKRPEPDKLSLVLLKATGSHLRNMSCSTFTFEYLIPALTTAGVFHDEEQASSADDYQRWRQRVFKRVSRIISGDQPMPADWFIPWLSVLPSQLRERCTNSTAAALGLLPIKIPAYDELSRGARAQIDTISREFADVISASRPAMDGSYTLDDGKEALQLLQNELQELEFKVRAEIVAIAASTGITPAKFSISREAL
ncbi:MAG: hypothetical protein E5W55_19830 [Mesorhizobium sp.]|nr:MAG: hypothetical protein E5W55_19830 [Mesorhizobium sp.]